MLTRRAIEVLKTMIAAEEEGEHDDAEFAKGGHAGLGPSD